MTRSLAKLSLEELLEFHAGRKAAVQSRLGEFRRVSPLDYFYELVYCMLTPQSTAINASRAVELLKHHNFLKSSIDPVPLLHQENFYVRFHQTKGKYLLAVKTQFPEVVEQLQNGSSGAQLREWLVKNVKGIGYKEASHFLRNIGYQGLAILDRHILKSLVRLGVLHTFPVTLTRKRYLAIEKKFQNFADRIGISIDELDLVFWSMETGEILK